MCRQRHIRRGNTNCVPELLRTRKRKARSSIRAIPHSIRAKPSELMRIAQVAPLYESVPPRAYGGTERVVSSLTEQLVRDGHEVTLFASGDSSTSARLISIGPRALWHDASPWETPVAHSLLLE